MRNRISIALLALIAAVPSLWNGFAYDDVTVIAGDSRIHHLDAPWRFFTQTYWGPGSGGRLYRPLTSLAFAIEWRLGHGEPWIYHAVNLLLYILVCLVVYRFAVALLDPLAAWGAAALFAVHPVHVEAVANSVAQSELWAALWLMAAVAYYVETRRTRAFRLRDAVLIAGAYGIACLFKEHALMMPALLIGAELTVLRDAPTKARDQRAVLLLGPALLLTAIAFWSARAHIIGEFVGDRPTAALYGLSTSARLLTMLGIVPEWARLLFFPAHLQADYMPQEIRRAEFFGWPQLAGLVLLIFVAIGAVRALRRQPVVPFAALWAAVILFPVSNVVVVSGVILAERTLFLPSVAAVLALGAGIEWAVARARYWPAHVRKLGFVCGLAVLAACAVRSGLRMPVWKDNQTLFAQMLVDAPRSYRSRWIEARRLNAAGDLVSAQREYRLALTLFPYDAGLLADAADRHGTANRCADALPLYRRSLTIDPNARFIRTRFIRCLVKLQCLTEAREVVSASLVRSDLDAREDSVRVDSLARALEARSDSVHLYHRC